MAAAAAEVDMVIEAEAAEVDQVDQEVAIGADIAIGDTKRVSE
jgi:hypothetical protein